METSPQPILPEKPPEYNRLRGVRSRRFVVVFVIALLSISIITTWIIQRGRTNPEFQSQLAEFRQSLLPSMLNTEIAANPAYENLTRKLRTFIEIEMADKEIPALSIALVEGNSLQWAKGFGIADSAENIPATPQTVYRVASVSKLFTNLAIMRQVEAGLIDLDAPVSTFLPEVVFQNPFGEAVTVRQLMSHRAGIVREPPLGSYFDANSPTLQQTVASLDGTPVIYSPGERTKYSNAGVTLLGAILEKVTGQSFSEHLHADVLAPLTMDESTFNPDPILKRRLADSYMWTYDGRLFPAPTFQLGIEPAAGLYTTMLDLSRFLSMLFQDGKLPNGETFLTRASLDEMWTPQFTDEQEGFGLGFFVTDFHGHKKVQHSGVHYGFATRVFAVPDLGFGVAVSANLDNVNPVVDRIASYALDLMKAQREYKPLPDPVLTEPVTEAQARELEGSFSSGSRMVRLFRENNQLYLDDGNRQLRIRKLDGSFITDGRLSFGTVVDARENGVVINGEFFDRIREKPTGISASWKEFVGSYGWPHNTLYIFPRNGKLQVLIEWFDRYPLKELAPDRFKFPDEGLYAGEEVRFLRGTDGKVDRVVAAGIEWPLAGTVPDYYLHPVQGLEGNTSGVAHITPIRTLSELRSRASEANPPAESGDFLASDLVEIVTLDPTVRLDIRYATQNNFMGSAFYDESRAFLQRPAAEALVRVHSKLEERGLGIVVFDAYRPWYVTKMFWDATPEHQKDYVAKPSDGSRHNRGCAVDVTLFDLETGKVLEMPSLYDEFSERANIRYAGGTDEQRSNRSLLISTMRSEGFNVLASEWWHFDYKDWRRFRINNIRFAEI